MQPFSFLSPLAYKFAQHLVQNQPDPYMIQAEEQALHTACMQGDLFAERRLYERYKGKMFGMCLRYANNRTDAEDMLQEGFLQVFRDLKNFRGDGSMEGWVRRVILHVVFKHLRRQKNERTYEIQTYHLEEIEEMEESADTDESGGDETSKQLIRLMQKLPTGFRTVLNLYVLEGYTHLEIAEIMDISVGTSKSQYMRAKAALRQLFEQKLSGKRL